MQAITTFFLAPTNSKDARIKAKAARHSVTLAWDYSVGVEQNHDRAAEALVKKMNWLPSQGKGFEGQWVRGGFADGSNVYVFACDHAEWSRGSFRFRAEA